MKSTFAAIALSGALLAGNAGAQVLVDGSADAGKTKSVTCAACHGADGNSVNPLWPSIAGQHASYIVAQLGHFKSGARVNALMSSQAINLTEEDMRDLAAYYSAQTPAVKTVSDASLVPKGQSVYRAGNADSGVSACIACHGPTGAGNPASQYPLLHGQYAVYTAKTLRDYKSGARDTGRLSRMMQEIAGRMTEDEIDAVASYIQGLRGSVAASD
ncbi:MAG TPA: cytochrome c4 [Porticoccaceae bacterium]|nr:cytochrome c4 [Porticoccaceae bacterium]